MINIPKVLEYIDVCYKFLENTSTIERGFIHNKLTYDFLCYDFDNSRNVLLKSGSRTEYKFLIRLYENDSPSFSNITAYNNYIRILNRKDSDYVVINNNRYSLNCIEEELFQYQTVMSENEYMSYYLCLKSKHYNCNYTLVIRNGYDYSVLDRLIEIVKHVE